MTAGCYDGSKERFVVGKGRDIVRKKLSNAQRKRDSQTEARSQLSTGAPPLFLIAKSMQVITGLRYKHNPQRL